MTKPQPLFTSKVVFQVPETQLEVCTNQYGEVELSNGGKLVLTLPAKKAEGLAQVLDKAAKDAKPMRRKPRDVPAAVIVSMEEAAEAVLTGKIT